MLAFRQYSADRCHSNLNRIITAVTPVSNIQAQSGGREAPPNTFMKNTIPPCSCTSIDGKPINRIFWTDDIFGPRGAAAAVLDTRAPS